MRKRGRKVVFEYRRSGEVAGWDFEDVTAFLVGRGYAVGPGGVGCGVDGTAALVRADLDRDPSADLDTYVPPPNPLRNVLRRVRQRATAIRGESPAVRLANMATEQDLLDVLFLIRSDL